ncbi:MAG TPA: substrate-binding domain-containing protein, partial [Haliscomenobacter sp.]|nr:substrate-binding domain-containing protein [Haliscomenobacter sp.]
MVLVSIEYKSLLLSILCFWFSACSEQPQKSYTIGFSQCCDDPWRNVMNNEVARELTFHPEFKLELRSAANNSNKQIEQIRELAKRKIDLLIVSPNESKPLTEVINEVYRSGIPVILIDRKTDSELFTAYVGADNYEIGKTAGEYIASQFPKQGNIIEIRLQMTISPAVERSKGFKDAIDAAPQLKIVDILEAENGLEDITEKLPIMLKKHPETNIIFG